MTKFISRLLNWLKFWDDDKDLGWIPKDWLEEARDESPDMELYDDCYPWSRR